jgi:DNA-binding GntR family transcriptional regulator
MEVLSVTKTVAEYLRGKIITNEFESGQKLNEADLASELNISRAPLREAFSILESEHLLARLPRKGTYVTKVSIEGLRKLSIARKMIESYAIDLLKSKDVRHLESVSLSVTQASELPLPQPNDRKEIISYLRGLTDFHVKLVATTGNHWIIAFYDSIITSLARYQYFCIRVPGLTHKSQESHEKICGLLADGSYERAKKVLTSHIDYTLDFIESYIKEELVSIVGGQNASE